MNRPDPRRMLELYFLSELSPSERTEVEERLLKDTAFCELAAEVENDLYDRFVSKDLTASEMQKFSAVVGSNAGSAHKMLVARALQQQRIPAATRSFAPWLVAATLLLGTSSLLWWVFKPAPVETILVRVPTAASPPAAVAMLDLPAVVVRGTSVPIVALSADQPLRLRFELRDPAQKRIRVEVRRAGSTVWSGDGSVVEEFMGEAWVPPGMLTLGFYEASVDSGAGTRSFPFEVKNSGR